MNVLTKCAGGGGGCVAGVPLLVTIVIVLALVHLAASLSLHNFTAATAANRGLLVRMPRGQSPTVIDSTLANRLPMPVPPQSPHSGVRRRTGKVARSQCGTRSVRFQPQRSGKIVGGTVPPYGAYPWQVEIQMFRFDKSEFEHHCGGAVIGERLVLTAAHCLQVPQLEYLRLVIGDYNLDERDLHEHSFRLEKILTHPDFRKTGPYSNDIAIIKVRASSASGIGFNTHVRPICLPDMLPTPPPGTWCSVTGWGAQRAEDMKSLAPVLRAAAVPLLDDVTCRKNSINGGRQQEILDTMLCAGFLQGGVDACGGDSGGPLACEYENNRFMLAGVVSWGDGCAKKNRPGVYTRVESFLGWIHASIDQLEAESE